ncbi:MAG: divalent metal cation transporter [Patescibacteria group bacterium]|nr:divalent metal cation transporter [Patescibacteria group bacterium]
MKKARDYWHLLGPGLTTGAADDDPSGIATYSQTGAQYGFNMLWLAVFTFPLMAVVQEMCARIGLVTGRGLAANIRLHYSKGMLYASALLLFAANTFNIGADLGAMAKAAQLFWPRLNFAGLVLLLAGLMLLMQIFISYGKYAKYLKWLSLTLLAYIATAFAVHINWQQALMAGLVPRLSFGRQEIFLLCGILGTTISPYLFFWQTSQEVEEKILQGQTTIKQRQVADKPTINNMRFDVWFGMFFSNLVMFFIILTCGAVLFSHGLTDIQTAEQAAAALEPFAGRYAFSLFAVGIISVGILAVPVLAGSASYAISEAFGWKEGLYRKFRQAEAFYGIIILAMALGLLMNFLGLDAIKTLIYAAVLNGIIAPIVLIPVVQISGNKKIMGQWRSGNLATVVGWATILLMISAGAVAVAGLFF